jgi:hypothetical protein
MRVPFTPVRAGMEHGFALRGDYNSPTVLKEQETAYQAGVKFLKKYL